MSRRLVVTLLAALAGAWIPHLAAAQDEPPQDAATKALESAEGEVVFTVPGSWRVERLDATAPAKLEFRFRPHDGAPSVRVWGYAMLDVRNARGRCVYEYPWHLKNYGAAEGKRLDEPFPHLWTRTDHPAGSLRHLFALRHVNRVALVALFEVPEELWEEIYPAALDVVARATTRLEDVAERPAGHRVVEKDGYRYLLAPGVKDGEIASTHAALLAFQKEWEKEHGPLRQPPENPIEILFQPRPDQADALARKRGFTPWTSFGFQDLPLQGQIVTSKLPPNDAAARADFAYGVTRVFVHQTYDRCLWLREAEGWCAWMEARIGKPLPAFPEARAADMPTIPKPFAELVDMEADAAFAHRDTLALYLGLFRTGPKPYKEAWAAFLAELRRTGDWHAAEKILLALDQDKLVSDAVTYRTKTMKAVRPK
jgi:hypothetical protein